MSNTSIDEVGPGIYRIHTPVEPSVVPGGFSFNQYLVLDDEPLLFHTGSRRLAEAVSAAIARVVPMSKLRHIAFSHFEADECGGLNPLLAAAPNATPLCSRVNAMINGEQFDRPARGMKDGEELSIGSRRLRWMETPHLPHGWDCGYLFDTRTSTLFCGDLFTQPGHDCKPLTTGDILGPSEAFSSDDYWAHSRDTQKHLARLAALKPRLLACMHGSAWSGAGQALLGELAKTRLKDA